VAGPAFTITFAKPLDSDEAEALIAAWPQW